MIRAGTGRMGWLLALAFLGATGVIFSFCRFITWSDPSLDLPYMLAEKVLPGREILDEDLLRRITEIMGTSWYVDREEDTLKSYGYEVELVGTKAYRDIENRVYGMRDLRIDSLPYPLYYQIDLESNQIMGRSYFDETWRDVSRRTFMWFLFALIIEVLIYVPYVLFLFFGSMSWLQGRSSAHRVEGSSLHSLYLPRRHGQARWR